LIISKQIYWLSQSPNFFLPGELRSHTSAAAKSVNIFFSTPYCKGFPDGSVIDGYKRVIMEYLYQELWPENHGNSKKYIN
jgi:hypothetical protein